MSVPRRAGSLALAAVVAIACGGDSTGPSPISFVQPPGDSVFIGSSLRIVSISTYGRAVITAAPIQWSSSDSSIALVDASGAVFGLGIGSARISAVLDGHRSSMTVRVIPLRADGGVAFSAMSSGYSQNCALRNSGVAYCRDFSSADSLAALAPIAGGSNINFATLQIAPGHACGVATDGVVYCWGSNSAGQLLTGHLSPQAATLPAAAATTLRFSRVSTGGTGTTTGFSCAINKADSVVYCAGANFNNQLGRSPATNTDSVIAPVVGRFRALEVGAGRGYACAIGTDRNTYCWGGNALGVLGIDPSLVTTTATPHLVPGGHMFAQLSTGSHACAITTDQELFCWGTNRSGQLALGPFDNTAHATPARISLGAKVASVLAGNGYTCAITVEGRLYCWGLIPLSPSILATLGFRRFTPVEIGKGIGVRSVSADPTKICGVTTDDRVICL